MGVLLRDPCGRCGLADHPAHVCARTFACVDCGGEADVFVADLGRLSRGADDLENEPGEKEIPICDDCLCERLREQRERRTRGAAGPAAVAAAGNYAAGLRGRMLARAGHAAGGAIYCRPMRDVNAREPAFARAQRICVLGARLGFSVAISAVIAEAIAVGVGRGMEGIVYATTGATFVLLAWRASGRIFGGLEKMR